MAEAIYGLVAEFADPQRAAQLARKLKESGLERFEVYSPLPIAGMEELITAAPRRWLAGIMFAAALFGIIGGYLMQYVLAAVDYPLNVGGRPLNSWPAFMPTSWEICAVFTVYVGFVAFLIACRLPRLYDPVFKAPNFASASQDRILLCVEAADPKFDRARLAVTFADEGALSVREVPL